MLNISRSKTVLKLALPIMAGMMSQSLLNLVDAAMVGTLGEAALAGVGLGGYANFMSIALIIGLGSGVQAMVARRVGEQEWGQTAIPLNSGLVWVLLVGVPVFIVFYLSSGSIIHFLTPDPSVQAIGTDYYQARVAGVFAVGMNFCFRGYWNGINKTTTYMRTLIAMHLFNVFISYGLIYGHFGLPEMGAVGAGIGTTIALYAGSALYLLQTVPKGRAHGFLASFPSRTDLGTLFRIALPNSLQQIFFASGLMALFWIISQVGTKEVAVAHVLITLVLFLILPSMGLGMAATSLVGQALGRKEPAEAYQWGWDVSKLAIILLLVSGLPMWIAPEWILSIFMHDPQLIELGVLPLQITGIAIFLDGVAIVLSNALLGAGASRAVMKTTISIQWLYFLPLAYLIGPTLGFGLIGIWLCQASQRLLTSIFLFKLWRSKRWASINL